MHITRQSHGACQLVCDEEEVRGDPEELRIEYDINFTSNNKCLAVCLGASGGGASGTGEAAAGGTRRPHLPRDFEYSQRRTS